jgi:hypothetical protein
MIATVPQADQPAHVVMVPTAMMRPSRTATARGRQGRVHGVYGAGEPDRVGWAAVGHCPRGHAWSEKDDAAATSRSGRLAAM